MVKSSPLVLIVVIVSLLYLTVYQAAYSQQSSETLAGEFPFRGASEQMQSLFLRTNSESDLFLVFLMYPRAFVRGEQLVKQIAKKVKATGWEGDVLGVARVNRYYGALHYAQEFRFPFPLSIDTSGRLFHSFGLTESAPWITVWNRRGELLYAKSTFANNVDTAVVSDILNVKDSKRTLRSIPTSVNYRHCLSSIHYGIEALATHLEYILPTRSFTVKDDSSTMLGNLVWLTLSPTGRFFSAVNRDLLRRQVFEKESGKLLGDLSPSDSLLFSLSSVEYDVWKEALRNMGAGTMSFGASFTAADTIVVFQVLPTVAMRVDGEDTVISIGNQHSLAFYHIDSITGKISLSRLLPIVYPPMSIESLVGNLPMQLTFDSKEEVAFVEIWKGYPVVVADPSTLTPKRDPRRKDFYNHAPLFWKISMKTGEIVGEVGTLDTIQWRYGLGYGISGRHVVVLGKNFYGWVEQFSSAVHLSDGSLLPLKSYCNANILNYRGKPDILLTDSDRQCILDSAGAYLEKLESADNCLGVVWRIREPDLGMNESNFTYVVQEYDILSKDLVAEKLIHSRKPWERIQDISYAHDGEWCGLIQTARTTQLHYFQVH